MFCERCHGRTATVHIRQNINGVYTEHHLCDECAQQEQALTVGVFPRMPFDFFFGNRAPFFLQMTQKGIGGSEGDIGLGASEKEPVVSERYAAFREKIRPFFSKIKKSKAETEHMDANIHATEKDESKELRMLREKLQLCIQREEYEEAGKIRDEIRDLLKRDSRE